MTLGSLTVTKTLDAQATGFQDPPCTLNWGVMENKMEATILENQMENEMETGIRVYVILGSLGYWIAIL